MSLAQVFVLTIKGFINEDVLFSFYSATLLLL